jgi:hypothetical protein
MDGGRRRGRLDGVARPLLQQEPNGGTPPQGVPDGDKEREDDMPMILLSKGAEILLVQFHERKGDRVGAKAGDRLPESAFMAAAADSTGVDFDGATQSLLDGTLVRQEDGEFILTQEGYDYLYSRAGHRMGEG